MRGGGCHASPAGHADVLAVGLWPEPFPEALIVPKGKHDVFLISMVQTWYRLVVTDSNTEECALLKSRQLVAVAPSKYF